MKDESREQTVIFLQLLLLLSGEKKSDKIT